MGATLATVASGAYHSGERSVVLKDRLHASGRIGLMYFWGRGNTAIAVQVEQFGGGALAATRAGIPTISTDYGSTTHWGNDTAISRTTEAWTYLKAQTGADADQVYLLGESMGFLAAANWARANPTKVAALVGVCPAIDLQDIHDVTRPDLASQIDTAYTNEAGYLAGLATHSPSEYAAELEDIPTRLYYSTNDDSITPATVTDYATAAGAEAISLGAVGHTAGTLDGADIAEFFAEHP